MPFVKGDPRINRTGRPKAFDMLRSLSKKIAEEPTPEGISQVEAILRGMTISNPVKFLEYAYGKVPDILEFHQVEDVQIDDWEGSEEENEEIDDTETPSSSPVEGISE